MDSAPSRPERARRRSAGRARSQRGRESSSWPAVAPRFGRSVETAVTRSRAGAFWQRDRFLLAGPESHAGGVRAKLRQAVGIRPLRCGVIVACVEGVRAGPPFVLEERPTL